MAKKINIADEFFSLPPKYRTKTMLNKLVKDFVKFGISGETALLKIKINKK